MQLLAVFTTCLSAVVPLAPVALAVNGGCHVEGEVRVCSLGVGKTTEYVLDQAPAKSLKLINHSDGQVQIFRVWTKPVIAEGWGEYCLSIGDWRTGQQEPGSGEVACTHKEKSEYEFGALKWDTSSIAPSVAPGSAIWVGGYVLTPNGKDHRQTVFITADNGIGRIQSFRQPRNDQPIKCNGEDQTTELSPWKNTTGRELTIAGAIIYAVDPRKQKYVDEACISVLDSAGTTKKWQICSEVNVRGNVTFPPVVVAPNEHISAQATNRCAAPGMWDWAAYIHVQ